MLFLIFLIPIIMCCPDGYYPESGGGKPCDSSCLTCTEPGACTSCENFMMLSDEEPTMGLGIHCLEGEYFDSTTKQGRNGENSGDDKGAYREEGMTGDQGYYNLETGLGVDQGDPGKV